MKYIDPITKEKKTIYTKASDTLPLGAIVDFDGTEIPDGWEPAYEDATVYIGPNEPTDGQDIWIRKGKNLLDPGKIFSNTAYYTINQDKSVNVIAFDGSNINEKNGVLLKPGTYTLSCRDRNNSYIQIYNLTLNEPMIDRKEDVNTFTIDVESIIAIKVYNEDLTSFPFTIHMMLEAGDTATEYEPYIDKKVYLKNEAGKYDLFVKNRIHIGPEMPTDGEEVWIQASKNAFDTKLLVQGGWNNPSASDRVVWGMKVKAGEIYTISNYSQKRISIFETTNLIQSVSNNSVLVEHGSLDGVGNMTITVVNNTYLRLLFSNLDNSSISVSDILPSNVQVEQGTAVTSYEPYVDNEKILTKTNNNVYEKVYSYSDIRALNDKFNGLGQGVYANANGGNDVDISPYGQGLYWINTNWGNGFFIWNGNDLDCYCGRADANGYTLDIHVRASGLVSAWALNSEGSIVSYPNIYTIIKVSNF